jgi:hypothetical protein
MVQAANLELGMAGKQTIRVEECESGHSMFLSMVERAGEFIRSVGETA